MENNKQKKSIFKRIRERVMPIQTVYAGPEYFDKRKKGENTLINDVYGGPEMDKVEFEGVYGGPELPEDQQQDDPIACVYAGPEFFDKEDDQPISLIYAGPDYFANKQPEKNQDLPYPNNYQKKAEKFCLECGCKNDVNAHFCNECGTPFKIDLKEEKDQTV